MRVPLRGNSWRLLLPAVLLLALLCAALRPLPRRSKRNYRTPRASSSDVREGQSALAATIAEQNREIDSMIGEVAALRQQQAAVEPELAAKQAELDAATAELEASATWRWSAPSCSAR